MQEAGTAASTSAALQDPEIEFLCVVPPPPVKKPHLEKKKKSTGLKGVHCHVLGLVLEYDYTVAGKHDHGEHRKPGVSRKEWVRVRTDVKVNQVNIAALMKQVDEQHKDLEDMKVRCRRYSHGSGNSQMR